MTAVREGRRSVTSGLLNSSAMTIYDTPKPSLRAIVHFREPGQLLILATGRSDATLPGEVHSMKRVLTLLILLIALSSPALATDADPIQTMHLTNGAVATAYDHCGDMDLCAKISYSTGNVLTVYSEGAAECQPYFLHFVYADGTGRTLFEFSKALNHTHAKDAGCGHTVSTEMVLDRGYVHMTVAENPDGTINATFSVAKE
jgi:hypothetical protein